MLIACLLACLFLNCLLFPVALDCQMVASLIRSRIEEFRPYVPLVQGLRNPGMRMHHWESLSQTIQIKVVPKAKLTLSRCLELGLQNHMDAIAQVAETAGKEYTIEQVTERELVAFGRDVRTLRLIETR